ncbi:TPA: type I-E CRISPR-associated protein Cas6/Cse3/CasE [Citrobacter freundii]|nr:type I-E CRISPR-associated protein Cas6/Cse3/CasE [Citrobacter freundii]
MYLSKITLHTSQLLPSQLLQLVDSGEYVMHQWLWELFPGGQERSFLYRREELRGAFRFFVLSSQPPEKSQIFEIEHRPFAPVLSLGQTLRFSLRANPTVCKGGKRHDLLMEAKCQARLQPEGQDIWQRQQQAACDWLARQGALNGFSLHEVSVDAYRQQQIIRAKARQMIQFSSVDYSGVLVVNDPVLFLQRLTQGYGKSRAFGCGLMLIKPGEST